MSTKANALVIRRSRPGDETFLEDLSIQVFAQYSRNPEGALHGMHHDPDAMSFVAEQGGLSVGFAIVGFETLPRAFGPWTKPTIAHLNAIAVRPTRQGSGAGLALLVRVEDEARKRGAVSISLRTAVDNRRARQLFEPFGFFVIATLDDFYTNGQRAVAMLKPIH